MPKVNDLLTITNEFKVEPSDRNASFDYCYNYFRVNRREEWKNEKEKSCLAIGFYLASWGMLRGSSFLLQKSIKYYEPLIMYLSTCPVTYWEIDVSSYQKDENTIINISNDLTTLLAVNGKTPSVILVTKIMLGIFGCIPAYDQNFVKAFNQLYPDKGSFIRVDKKSLGCLKDFYDSNKDFIDNMSKATFTTGFLSEAKTEIHYTRAKIIDMYGFTKGEQLIKEDLVRKSIAISNVAVK